MVLSDLYSATLHEKISGGDAGKIESNLALIDTLKGRKTNYSNNWKSDKNGSS